MLESPALVAVRIYSTERRVDRENWTPFCAHVNLQPLQISTRNLTLRGIEARIENHWSEYIHLIYDEELALLLECC